MNEPELIDSDRFGFKARLLEAAPESIIATDKEGRILSWGKGATQLFGWKPREMMGKGIETIFPEGSENNWQDLFKIPLIPLIV